MTQQMPSTLESADSVQSEISRSTSAAAFPIDSNWDGVKLLTNKRSASVIEQSQQSNVKPNLGLTQMSTGINGTPMGIAGSGPNFPIRFVTSAQSARTTPLPYTQRTAGPAMTMNGNRSSIQNGTSRSQRLPSLPPVNTYSPRLKYGLTSMMKKVVGEEDRRKRSKFVEPEEEFEDEDSDLASYSASEDEELENKRRNIVRGDSRQDSSRQTLEESDDDDEIKPFVLKDKERPLRSTKHDYEKLHLAKVEQFSNNTEILVPIRIELDLNGYKLQDVFTWNLQEQLITKEKFAEYVCEDLGIGNSYVGQIAKLIKLQLDEYYKFYMVVDTPVPEDTRIIVKLDVSSGKVHLRDRFEWDISSDLRPEEFASILVGDLQLGSEFVTLIAHSIHEQVHQAKQTREFDNNFAIEKPLRAEEEARTWSPFINCGDLSDDDMENPEEDRKQRLLRRQQRLSEGRRGPSKQESSIYIPPPQVAMTLPHVLALPADIRNKWCCTHCGVKNLNSSVTY